MKFCPMCEGRYDDPAAVFCSVDATKLVVLAEAKDRLVGRVLGGKYRIVRRIGEGGMGRVYEAQHSTLGRRCAVKIVLPEFSSDPEAMARFRREAVAAGGIDHSNIVGIFDVDQEADGTTYLVMEYLDGPDLRTVLTTTPILPLDRCLHIAGQICDAVAAAHAHGIVHRDLKPENVVLVRRGADPDHVKVLDFGVSKLAGVGQKLTKTGLPIGTPAYMSPEQALGRPDVDHRADVYAVGAMVYEMLAGRPPVVGATATEVIARLLTETPPPPRRFNPGLPPAIEEAICRAIAREPADRFDGCAAFAAALGTALRHSSVATGPTLRYGGPPDGDPGVSTGRPVAVRAATASAARGAKAAPRRAGRWIALAAILVVCVAGAVVGTMVAVGAWDEPAATRHEERPAHGPLPPTAPDETPTFPAGERGAEETEPILAAMPRGDPQSQPAVPEPAPAAAPRPGATVVTAVASREMSHYEAAKVLDGDSGTAWGFRGDPVGEWIEIRLDPPVPVAEVVLQTGFVKINASGVDVFTANRRLRDVRLVASYADGSWHAGDHVFADDRAWQRAPLPGPSSSPLRSLRIVVRSVYEGDRWPDTHVSEIRVRPAGSTQVTLAPPAIPASVAAASAIAAGAPGGVPIPPCPTEAGDRSAAEEWIREGRRKEAAGDVEGELRAYREAVAADPTHALAYSVLAYAYLGNGRPRDALAPALRYVACQPAAGTSWMRLGDTYVQLGDDATALWAYGRALEVSPGAPAVLLRKGDLEWMRGDAAAASEAWRAACEGGSDAACRRVDRGLAVTRDDWRPGWGTGASHVVVPEAESAP